MLSNNNKNSTLQHWQSQWPAAKKIWSDFVKLREPLWCLNTEEAEREGLTESFAMIRLTDHRIVINIDQVNNYGIQNYALQILAHEIGHHIYTPANLYDNAILMSRIRWGLAGLENRAPMVANIYEDFLINDRLHRMKQLDMAAVFEKINKDITYSKFWMLYMRSYEYLWRLKRGTLAKGKKFASDEIDADASLIASLIRSYSKNWLEGGGRFAVLVYPYLMEEANFKKSRISVKILLDTENAGNGTGVIAGLTEMDISGIEGTIDPRKEALEGTNTEKDAMLAFGELLKGGVGPQQRYLNPGIYIDLQQQLNPDIDTQKLVNNYYKEIALPHLISFPMNNKSPLGFTSMEGTELWDMGDPIEEIDWLESAVHTPYILPGYNTRKRIYGLDTDDESKQAPLDVYIGVDCSGSMANPSFRFSWPVLAAGIIALSALRAGAKVMGCLSGEPGKYLETKGFVSNEEEVLTVLTSYLGTGYAYGINRLKKPFGQAIKSKSHIVIVTDDDIFAMLNGRRFGTEGDAGHWELVELALQNAGGEGSMVLHSKPQWHKEEVIRLTEMGWRVYYVTNEEELLKFAATFAEQKYENPIHY